MAIPPSQIASITVRNCGLPPSHSCYHECDIVLSDNRSKTTQLSYRFVYALIREINDPTKITCINCVGHFNAVEIPPHRRPKAENILGQIFNNMPMSYS